MSKLFHFSYELDGAGWATARIDHGNVSVDMTASYLHDSLRELANAVFRISRALTAEQRVVFMDEPGEHQLTLTREGGECLYSVQWFDDWDSWGLRTLPGSTDICCGSVTVQRLVHQVYIALLSVYEKHGENGYKDQWIEHEFPSAEMQRLAGVSDRHPY
jgi:hypothetical protein